MDGHGQLRQRLAASQAGAGLGRRRRRRRIQGRRLQHRRSVSPNTGCRRSQGGDRCGKGGRSRSGCRRRRATSGEAGVRGRCSRRIADQGAARVAAGEDATAVAREVVTARNVLKAGAREGMSTPLRRWAERRNMARYGDPIGPTYEYYVGQGKLPEQIIAGSGRTANWINTLLRIK